jgi:hypothetical protein
MMLSSAEDYDSSDRLIPPRFRFFCAFSPPPSLHLKASRSIDSLGRFALRPLLGSGD